MTKILEDWANDLARRQHRAMSVFMVERDLIYANAEREAMARQYVYAVDPVAAAKLDARINAQTPGVRTYATMKPPPPFEHRCAWCGGWSTAQLCPHCGGPR